MNTYIYVLKLIPRLYNDESWTKEDESIVMDHFNKLKEDHENKKVILAGRTDKTDEDGFGIVIFKAADISEATAYMNSDPAVANGIMTAKVQKYHIALI